MKNAFVDVALDLLRDDELETDQLVAQLCQRGQHRRIFGAARAQRDLLRSIRFEDEDAADES